MSKNFSEVVRQSQVGIELLSPEQVKRILEDNSNTLILDVRDECDLNITGIIDDSVNISLGTLFYKADHEMPAEHKAACLADKERIIITTCTFGLVASIAAKVLKDYGFTNVKILEGGNTAWKAAGLPLQQC